MPDETRSCGRYLLRRGPVYVEGGLFVLDVDDRGEKHLKTRSSKRIIPVHGFVRVDLGFEEYVGRINAEGEQCIFPGLPRVNRRRSHKPSRDSGRFIAQVGIAGKNSFHSFRHAFINELLNKDVREAHIACVTGHRVIRDTAMPSNYKKQFGLPLLVEEVMVHIDYASVVIPKL